MDIDEDGIQEYLLVIRDDKKALCDLSFQLALVRHVGGAQEPTLLSRPVFLETAGPISSASQPARLLGRPRGFLSQTNDGTLWINESERMCDLRLFRRADRLGRLEIASEEVRGPVRIALVDLEGRQCPDLIGGCFAGYPSDYFPDIGNSTDNAPWPEIVRSRFDEQGRWRGGQERGYLYRFRNSGTPDGPLFEELGTPVLDPQGHPIQFNGVPSVCPVDLDGDGDTDLLCGQCDNTVEYLENIGETGSPQFIKRGPVRDLNGEIWQLCTRQSQPAAMVRDPSGRMLVLLDGMNFGCMPFAGMGADGVPRFGPEETFYTRGGDVRGKTFAVPVPVDWDGDGDFDLISGSETGEVEFIENAGSAAAPVFAAPIPLKAEGEDIRIVPGPGGSVQGPQEEMWGYSNPAVVDWDDDGEPDLILGTSLGLMFYYRNTGKDGRGMPILATGVPLRQGKGPFQAVWRQRPCIADLDGDGRTELLALDPCGHLTIYRKPDPADPLRLDAGTPLLDPDGHPCKLDGYDNRGTVMAGRTKLWLADITGSGTLDVIFGILMGRTAPVPSGRMPDVRWIENIGTPTQPRLGRVCRVLFNGAPFAQGRHTPAPCAVDLNGDGKLEMLIGIDEGALLLFEHSEIHFDRQPLPPQ